MAFRDQSYTEQTSKATVFPLSDNGDPIIGVIAVAVKHRDSWDLSYSCPFCQPKRGAPRWHHHDGGGLDDVPYGGPRITHCPGPNSPRLVILRVVVVADKAVAA